MEAARASALSDDDVRVREAAIQALGRLGDRAPLELLVQAADDDDSSVRRAAIRSLGWQGERAPVEPLVQAADDGNSRVRQAAIRALGRLGDHTPLELLVQAANDGNSSVRQAALEAVGQLGDRAPLELLVRAANDGNSSVREAAIQALGWQGERAPVEPLVQALGDGHSRVRQAAIWALGRLGDHTPLELLVQALGDRDSSVRNQALAVLAIAHPTALGQVMNEALLVLRGDAPGIILSPIARSATAELLSAVTDQRRGFLFDGFEPSEKALPAPSTPVASDAILQLLGSYLDDTFWQVRMKAIQALRVFMQQIPDNMIAEFYRLRHDPESRGVREEADDTLVALLSSERGGIEDD